MTFGFRENLRKNLNVSNTKTRINVLLCFVAESKNNPIKSLFVSVDFNRFKVVQSLPGGVKINPMNLTIDGDDQTTRRNMKAPQAIHDVLEQEVSENVARIFLVHSVCLRCRDRLSLNCHSAV